MRRFPYYLFGKMAHFYRPVAWKASGWTFAVYSHYDRGHFYNAHPKVFVTYKGGNSHHDPRFYAGRHMPKPAVHHPAPAVHRHAPAPAPHHGKPAATHNNRHGSDHHMAMNNGHSNRGHFGRR